MVSKIIIPSFAYIIIWILLAITWFIPTLSIHWQEFLNLTLVQMLSIILFIIPGTFPAFIVSIIGVVMGLMWDD